MNTEKRIQELLALKARALIHQSGTQLNEIIDPSFTYMNSHGKKSDKQGYIEQCTGELLKFKSQRVENLEVQDFGTFAVASMILHDEFEYAGDAHKGSFRSLCVFKKVGSQWLWAAGQTCEA